ncbi:MAG: hypothetical protein ACYDBB_13925 [Armatimonadota bacterium]
MTTSQSPTLSVSSGLLRRVAIPPTRDPFVNAPLLSVGPDEHGIERFWITTWNNNIGCLGVLINELGEYRIYRFPSHGGFYSAVVEDAQTLWLCGSLNQVVRLDLASGEFVVYPTGAPSALVFQGMAYDPVTHKLFAAAFPPPHTAAFSFNIQTRESTRVYREVAPAHYMRRSFPNGDGTYSIVLQCPETTILRWDPQSDEIIDRKQLEREHTWMVGDGSGRRYFPGEGWYDPLAGTFADGPKPEREAAWFARHGNRIFGAERQDTTAAVSVWSLDTGAVTPLCHVPDCSEFNLQVTASGNLVGVNRYGVFSRFNGTTGALELCKPLPTAAVGSVDCICRIDEERLLGTPFITQRFWEVNLRTGKGYDCGRAAPGSGEVLETWKLDGKIYMAAYGGGELVEYDPAVHPHYPENPHVVADPPGGMRPVAKATDGRHLFYACSNEYGKLGSVLTRYDTHTGLATYLPNPLPDQQICTMGYDASRNSLLCGTTYNADCESAVPTSDTCYFVRINAEALAVEATISAPAGTIGAAVVGPLGDGDWLCLSCKGFPSWSHLYPDARWFVLHIDQLHTPATEEMHPFPEGAHRIRYAGQPGLFLLYIQNRIELWDMCTATCLRVIIEGFDGYNYAVQENSLYLFTREEIIVVDDFLAE